jgi:metacaspase-1
MVKRALLIGINYKGMSGAELKGCINDVNNINNFIQKNCGYKAGDIRVLTDDTPTKPTRANMESALTWLVSGCKAGDTLFLHYSGHGSRLSDRNGDERDGHDEVFVPLDYQARGVITDDWLGVNVVAKVPAGASLFAFTDCCHSGSMLDLGFTMTCNSTYTKGKATSTTPYVARDWTNQYSMGNEHNRNTTGDIYMFSGCLDAQTSADAFIRGQSQGAFTACLLELLTANVVKNSDGSTRYNGRPTMMDVLKELTCRGYPQRPQFSVGELGDAKKALTL